MEQLQDQSDALALLTSELTDVERKFVDFLVQDPDFNLAAAARAVGYEAKPAEAAQRMLKKAAVTRYLAAIQADRCARHRDIRDGVIQALWQLAAGWDVVDLIGQIEKTDPESGEVSFERVVVAPDQLPAGLRAAIKGVKRTKEGWEYTFVDRAAILAMLLKHFGEGKGTGTAQDGPKEAVRKVVFFE